jgi:hypothetical protein
MLLVSYFCAAVTKYLTSQLKEGKIYFGFSFRGFSPSGPALLFLGP